MVTNKKHFDIFHKECQRLQKEWHLNGWNIRYEHKKFENVNAQMIKNGNCYNATMALSTFIDCDEFTDKQNTVKFIKDLAKHEMIHLLLGRVIHCAEARWCTDSELVEAEEELVRKLIQII
jgi:hypothetical protein